jgi:hypothetical protein
MEIIEQGGWQEGVRYERQFQVAPSEGYFTNGFGFSCDKNGKMDPDQNEASKANFIKCTLNPTEFIDLGVTAIPWRGKLSRIGRCDCGSEVYLDGFTNTCDDCDADYNGSGQRLAPRECWGEETGESLGDILSIP